MSLIGRFLMKPDLLPKGHWLAASLLLAVSSIVHAQLVSVDPDWKETEVPPPPTLNTRSLVSFDVPGSTLKWGLDEKSIVISPDGLIRYVVVAQSSSGTINAIYEGTRCATAQVKTYARHTPGAGWSNVSNPEWKSLFDYGPSTHSRRLVKQGLCDAGAPPQTVREIVRRIKTGDLHGP